MSKPKIGQFNNNIIRNNMTLINWILLAGIIVFTGIYIFSSIYFVLLVTTLIFGGTKSFSSYISCSGLFLASSLLNFFSMVYLCFISGLQAFFLFTGTLISLLVVAFYIIFDSRKFNFKNRLIFILFVLSESLIMYSNLLI